MSEIDYSKLNKMPLGDVMFSQRSVRRYKPDPIPYEDLHLIMEAAVKAPNGGNAQPARFVLLTGRKVIQEMGSLYREAWWAKRRDAGTGWKTIDDIPAEERTSRSAARLADAMKDVPAIVLCFGRKSARGDVDSGSVIPAVQNLMLAARALGIGSLPTTLHADVMERVYNLLGVPETASFHFLVPLGYPASERAFGPTSRKPTSETVFLDQWGGQVPWS
ncbi:MAG TPA: nitroreductase family protein [Dehalococcoidia bacterium]|nr:nitroreductase family protein [Dehalococcoidia bacterium]